VLPAAPVEHELRSPAAGFVRRVGAVAVGNAAVHLGAGRRTKEDTIDHAVGVLCLAKRGDAVEQGQPLARVLARDDASAATAVAELLAAYEIASEPPPERPVLLEVVD
jgi:thymidine phosphorylase